VRHPVSIHQYIFLYFSPIFARFSAGGIVTNTIDEKRLGLALEFTDNTGVKFTYPPHRDVILAFFQRDNNPSRTVRQNIKAKAAMDVMFLREGSRTHRI
jgi:hypothetical protein